MMNHMIALVAGFILDLIFGDPYWLHHPIRLIGRLIGTLEKQWNCQDSKKALRNGGLMVLTVTGSTVIVSTVLLMASYRIHSVMGIVVEAIMTYQILATKC